MPLRGYKIKGSNFEIRELRFLSIAIKLKEFKGKLGVRRDFKNTSALRNERKR